VSTGDEWPGGSAVFQITFLLGPNSSGSPVDAETPLPFGPRNCGQSSVTAVVNAADELTAAINDAIDKAKIIFLTFDIVRRERRDAVLGERRDIIPRDRSDIALRY